MYTEYSVKGIIISVIIIGFAFWKLAQIAKRKRDYANKRDIGIIKKHQDKNQ